MAKNNELKEIDIKIAHVIILITKSLLTILIFITFHWKKNHMKTF